MASIDTIGLVNIIDECFDAYNDKYTPYIAEENASIFSFLKKSYAIIKDGTIFDNQRLLDTYKECVRKILIKLNQIENRKVYKYSFRVDITKTRMDYFISFFEEMWKYVDRHFPKNLTENEIKVGYYETLDGETFFNGYRENIVIGGQLKPTYEDDKVVYKIEDNPYCIKMNGIVKPGERTNIQLFINGVENFNSPFYSLQDFLRQFKALDETVFSKFYSINDELAPRLYFAFSNGFVVNDMNEYENPNGIIYDIFNNLGKSLENSEKNYFKDFLKNYLYTGIINRYREKTFDDKETSLILNDLNFGRFDNIIPGVDETLSGKGGDIGGLQTIDFDNRTVLGKSEYVRLMFDKSYYNPENNKIEIYINKKNLKGTLSKISKFNGISGNKDSYLNYISDRYNQLKYYDGFNKENIKFLKKEADIEEILLKEELFAVEPWFWPENNQDENWDSEFFINNAKKIQKVYFYDDDSYLKEDDILKELSVEEGDNKQFVRSQRNRNISVNSDEKNLIIYLQNDYITNVNEKKYLGGGYVNIKKVPQKFKDNKVSKLVDNEYTNKNSYFESEEFSSALDDREITIIHTTPDMFITQTENGFLPSFTGTYLDCEKHNKEVKFVKKHTDLYRKKEFPEFKVGTLHDGGEFLELECTEFADYVDIGSLRQIRVMSTESNSQRYLFNVKGIKKNKVRYQTVSAYFDNLEDLNKRGYSFPVNNRLSLAESSVETYSIKGKFVTVKNDASMIFENFFSEENSAGIEWIDSGELKDKNYIIDINTEDEEGKPNNTAIVINNTNKYSVDNIDGVSNEFALALKDIEFEIEENFYFEYKLLLQKNEYVKNMNFNNDFQVYILDYIQMSGRPERKEFLGSTYKDNGEIDILDYVPEKEKIRLYFPGLRKNINAYMIRPVCILNSLKQLNYAIILPNIRINKNSWSFVSKLNKNWLIKGFVKKIPIFYNFLKDFYLIYAKYVGRRVNKFIKEIETEYKFKDDIEPEINLRNRIKDEFKIIFEDIENSLFYRIMNEGELSSKEVTNSTSGERETIEFEEYNNKEPPEALNYMIIKLLKLIKKEKIVTMEEDLFKEPLNAVLTNWYDNYVYDYNMNENIKEEKYYPAILYKEIQKYDLEIGNRKRYKIDGKNYTKQPTTNLEVDFKIYKRE